MSEKNFVSSKNKMPVWAISFLVVVLLVTLGLFFYNYHLDNTNAELVTKIEERKSDIRELSKDDKLQVFALIESNKFSIDELTKRTDVTKYIMHLKAVAQKYDLVFEWFKLSQWTLKSSVIIESSEEWGIAYTKTIDFIKNYRSEKNWLFELNFINSIEWMDSMKFNVNFDIK